MACLVLILLAIERVLDKNYLFAMPQNCFLVLQSAYCKVYALMWVTGYFDLVFLWLVMEKCPYFVFKVKILTSSIK